MESSRDATPPIKTHGAGGMFQNPPDRSDSRDDRPAKRGKVPLTRVDLHVHTRASSRGATGWLEALGIAESYSEPERVYEVARARGMDLVAVTDHDTVEGALELVERGYPGVIVGEEITTRMPGDGRLLHVLVWMLDADLHEQIGTLGLRNDAVALAHWIRENNLPHALAHPLYDMSGGLDRRTLERLMLLFGGVEAINGGHTTARHRAALDAFLRATNSERYAELTTELGEPALWPRRWLTAGSDDHATLNIARAWTAAPGSHTPDTFFQAVMRGGGHIGGRDATTRTLAHQFVAVAGGFLDSPGTHDGGDARVAAWTRAALAAMTPMRAAFTESQRAGADPDADHARIDSALASAMRAGRVTLPRLSPGMKSLGFRGDNRAPEWDELLDPGMLMRLFALAPGVAGAIAAQGFEVYAAVQHVAEMRLIRDLISIDRTNHADQGPASDPPTDEDNSRGRPRPERDARPVCLFVDSLDHTSGVSRFVLDLAAQAESLGRPLVIFTCAAERGDWPASVRCVDPVGLVEAPGYAGLRLALPRAAELIEEVAALDPSAVHVSTPGPVGVCGMIAAKALGVPLLGTHHTDLAGYAHRLLGSKLASLVTARALAGMYGRFDRVLARSRVSAVSIEELGVAAEKVRVITPGIDLSRFGPRLRDPAVWDGFAGVSRSTVKALYVGRVSIEKNTPMLAAVWREAERLLARAGVAAELIVVGDGPALGAMRDATRGSRVRFLGEIRDERLPRVFASSDLFMFPSATDTLGQVVIEAQASGLPAIVTDAGGPAEIVIDRRTGMVLAADDEEVWAREIARLGADSPARRAMGQAALFNARRFSFERSFESFWSIHREPIAEHRGPTRAPSGSRRNAASPIGAVKA